MAMRRTWLEVKNGRVIVLDAAAARRQNARTHKKRKASGNKSKRQKRDAASTDFDEEQEEEEEEEEAVDQNDQLFSDAQAQLQQEMAAAGFDCSQLPMSFGSTGDQTTSSRKRKRQRDSSTLSSVATPMPVSVSNEQRVEKVRVVYDSDGEIVERSTETVILPATHEASKEQGREEEEAPAVHALEVVAEPTAQSQDIPDVDPSVFKFWKQRRTLFRKYDEGIQLDQESWYSVTPEAIAEYLAQRCACDVLVDPFSGCGGNIIQFAKTCKQVIAIEIDADKIRMAKHNAAIYGVADKIEWIHGDAVEILPTLKADVVFLSPPWGGMNYNRHAFSIDDMKIGDATGVDLFKLARRVAKNVVYYLPKTTPATDLQVLAPEEKVECEQLHLHGQLKVVNAYYGDLAFKERKQRDDGTVYYM